MKKIGKKLNNLILRLINNLFLLNIVKYLKNILKINHLKVGKLIMLKIL